MRIETYSISQINRTQSADRSQKPDPSKPTSSHDSLTLSSTGRLIMSARKAFQALPSMRAAKVEEVGTLLASGRYQPDPEAVARAMLGNSTVERSDGQ